MPWIRTVPYKEATGLLKEEYDTAIERAGRIYNILSLQSLRPRAMRASIRLYAELMHAPSGRLADALGIDPEPDMPPP
ncbi:MAG: hypothetical protein IH864_02470 [Chloroflexi bacterium]|nr:hypothetical protein [Chloroflexota bacterium]